jgi:hypothetical protein
MDNGETAELIVVQTMEGDVSFPEESRKCLTGLMAEWRARRDAGEAVVDAELSQLVEQELEATIERTRAITG